MTNQDPILIEDQIRAATVMPQANPHFVENLWQQISDLPQPKPTVWEHLLHDLRHVWFVPAAVTLALIVLFFGIGPQRVMAGIEALFSYLPGVGEVSNIDQAAILSGPVRQEKEGYAVTVENLVSSSERTWMRIKVEGWRESSDFLSHPDLQPGWPKLQPSSGQAVLANLVDTYIADALFAEYQFPSLPTGTKTVKLLLSQLPQTLQGEAPENWEFTLNLRQAEPSDSLPEAWSKPRTSPMVNGVSMSLLQVVQDTEATELTIRFDTPTLNDTLSVDWFTQLSLQDTQGHIYPLTFEKDLGGRSAVFQTRPFEGKEKLHLQLNHLLLVSEPQEGAAPAFTLDFGPMPQIGQHLTIDQTLLQGAHQVRISGVTLENGEHGKPRLVFDTESTTDGVQNVLLRCLQPVCGMATAKLSNNGGNVIPQPVIELKELPTGTMRVELALISYAIDGPWSIDWQPQAFAGSLQPRATASATPQLASSGPAVPLPVTNTPMAQSPQAILSEEVRVLLNKGFQALYGQAGWIHVVYENEEADTSAKIPAGNGIPVFTLNETWQYVEPDGTISKQVWFEKSPDGAFLQKIAQVGKTVVNFTTGTAVENDAPNKAQINSLPDWILRYRQMENVLREESVINGQSYLIITLQDRHDPAIEVTPLTKRVILDQSKTWINQETGFIWMTQTIYRFEDGTELINQSMRYSTMERINHPPQQVLDLLGQVLP
jgi:hypothetical protein